MLRPALPALIPLLKFTVHGHDEGLWYAVKTPDQRFLRVGRSEYLVASCLDGSKTAAEVVMSVREIDGGVELTEQDVLRVVSGLTRMGLVAVPGAEVNSSSSPPKFSFNPIYMKIPLVDGARLDRIGARLAPWIGGPTILVAAILWIGAAAGVLANWDWFTCLAGQLFVADSWMWWGLAWLLLKTSHELGHAVMAARVGSPIRSAGISLIFLAPVPYVDLTDLWSIPNRRQRILCCAGGMLVELSLASVAALVAISTESPALQYFCCALATMGTVSTIAFNASPLMRFDGYYIFSDVINYPNLYTDGQLAAKQFALKCLIPWRTSTHRMTPALVLYGLACYQYRIVMLASLAVGTVLALQGVGVALVAWGGYAIVLAPLIHSWRTRKQARCGEARNHPLSADQPFEVDRQSPQVDPRVATPPLAAEATVANQLVQITPMAIGWPYRVFHSFGGILWMGAVVGVFCGFILLVPAPIQPSIPGYVALRDPQLQRSETDGFLREVFVACGEVVNEGQRIARLCNPELELELSLKRNELSKVEETIRLRRAQRQLAELQAFEGERDALRMQVSQLERRVQGLTVFSCRTGVLVENDLARRIGLFLKAGEPLVMIAQPQNYEVIASIDQQDVEQMREVVGHVIAAHISGGDSFEGVLAKVDPRASTRLDAPLLAAIYGGPITVHKQQTPRGEEELKLAQPRFEMRLRLEGDRNKAIAPGQMVWIRLPGRPATLMDAMQRWIEHKWADLLEHSQTSMQ